MKNILKNTNKEVGDFFLNEKQYCSFPLPEYFSFQKLLDALYKENIDINSWKPGEKENINYKLFNNKDGEYSWRKLELIHPVLYVELIKIITDSENWNLLKKRFSEFQKNKKITCTSLPVISKNSNRKSINSWKNNFEKESIRLGIEYQYLLNTDVADCYGSIYTHSIDWAIHGKEDAKKRKNKSKDNSFGKKIDKMMQCMSNMQTNGIPQGSVLMDFIAEVVLGYVDLELSIANKKDKIVKYKILRFRDDYRIFVNNPEDGKKIIKNLSTVLLELGMRLSPEKTFQSDDVILGSIKKDRLDWLMIDKGNILIDGISETNMSLRSINLLDELMIIKDFANKHKNSGAIVGALKRFYTRSKKKSKINDIEILISVVVVIMYENPRFYYECSAIISTLMSRLANKKIKNSLLGKIKNKFKDLPNTEYLDLWIQNIYIDSKKNIEFQNSLCKKVYGEDIDIWNNAKLSKKIQNIFNKNGILNIEKLEDARVNPEIKFKEVFYSQYIS